MSDSLEYRENCFKCMRPSSSCMCSYINPLITNTHFVILMHPMEYRHIKNGTGRLTKLQLKNSSIIDGINFTKDSRVNSILDNPQNNCSMLYPGEGSHNLSESLPSDFKENRKNYIFILDATWPCAKKMLKLSLNLRNLKRVSFTNTAVSNFLIKQQPHPMCLSTIESVKIVLDSLVIFNVESVDTRKFLLPFEKMVEYQIDCTLRTDNNHYRGNNEVRPKDHYKNNPHCNIILTDRSQVD